MGDVPRTQYALNGALHLAYQQVPGDGPTILLVSMPHFPIDLMWDDPLFARNLRRLERIGRLITMDMHGWGSSDQPSEPFPALQVWMDDLVAVLEAVSVESATLVAHGEGARPALLFAAAHPERVDRLVLVNASARARAGRPTTPQGCRTGGSTPRRRSLPARSVKARSRNGCRRHERMTRSSVGSA